MDIDIDTSPSFSAVKTFPSWVRASRVQDGKLLAHPVGMHPQRIAQDPITKLSAVPFEEAEDLGYLKIDLLHVGVYAAFKDRAEIERFSKLEPDWALLLDKTVQPKLFQLAKHNKLLDAVKPTSTIELADCMALIRPGKRELLPIYLKSRTEVRKALYLKDEESGYSFKRSHAVAYALVVKLQLHLAKDGRL